MKNISCDICKGEIKGRLYSSFLYNLLIIGQEQYKEICPLCTEKIHEFITKLKKPEAFI